ncbi:MAG: hypothetical protein B7X02_02580 [Rhodospirillales bacterium 12-54-5]|nr:MAG: hypothetical protein B7X02_02580 [Rhodospirillales bacterium 12-54-5]
MTIQVLLVDDSAVIRKLLSSALQRNPDIRVIALAPDGQEAIEVAKRTQPDIIVLDIEMPVMESDYIPKPEIDNLEEFYRELTEKVLALAPSLAKKSVAPASDATAFTKKTIPAIQPATSQPVQAVAIAASTGGPQALMKLFADLGGALSHLPVFVTQHMPATFTPIFAEHLAQVSKMHCLEGKEGEIVRPGHVYIAPGDYHMVVGRVGSQVVIRTNQDAPVNFCRPAADPMFASLSNAYGPNLLALVLTGMGQDGAAGAEQVAKNGGSVIAQDASSCVVYGMPRATADRGICQEILPLDAIAAYLARRCRG